MLLKLTLAYDGTAFRGWARQPGERTVEAALADGLGSIYRDAGPIAVAGRTDAGVHALANVASVEVSGGPPPERALRALNSALPRDLAVVELEPAPVGFHARFSACSRTYRYRIWRSEAPSPFEVGRALWHPARIDLGLLAASASLLVGEHDFRAFTPTDTQHGTFVRRVLQAGWRDRGRALEFEVTADSFLRHMVRTLVGTMLERTPDELAALLRGARRPAAGTTVAACGLTLVEVDYGSPAQARPTSVAARRPDALPVPPRGSG